MRLGRAADEENVVVARKKEDHLARGIVLDYWNGQGMLYIRKITSIVDDAEERAAYRVAGGVSRKLGA